MRLTHLQAFLEVNKNAIDGMQGDEKTFVPLPVPDKYCFLEKTSKAHELEKCQIDVASLSQAFAQDHHNGTQEAPDFTDAIKLQTLINRISESSNKIFS